MSDLQTEFECLKRTGDEHYARKEYSIAAECYRAALERGPGDRNLLFNFAYSLAAAKNDTGAAMIYQQAIQAGSGAAAHNNLGLCYRRLGKNQEARDEFIKATRLERSDALYWRNLAVCLADLKESKTELKALEALSECDGCTAGDWNKLGCAREREGDVEAGLVAFRNAAAAAPEECAYFFNVALMHNRRGRALDAYHACRHSLNLNSAYESAAKMMPKLEKALERPPTPPPLPSKAEYKFNCPLCGQHISANESFAGTQVSCPSCAGSFTAPRTPGKPREIGPHDYVNPYVLLNFAGVSDSPEAFEWFDQPEDWDELLGSLTRRRRALKAELELNEGCLSWLPQLHITDEVVHRVLSDLDDSGWHPHHWVVFRLPLLNRFLMHGELDYFHSLDHSPYPLVAEIAGALDDSDHELFVEFISPYFRHQWSSAIKQALDTGNYAGASTLFFTTTPVTAKDNDEALEPVRRHFFRRREALKQFQSDVECGNFPDLDAELQSAADEARLLNILLAHLCAKLRDEICFAYRNISIALANHRNDYIASEQALKAAECFHASVTTQQRLTDDRAALNNLLKAAADRSARQTVATIPKPERQKPANRSGIGCLVAIGLIVFLGLIGSFNSNQSLSRNSISSPSAFTRPPYNENPPPSNYVVTQSHHAELDRDLQAVNAAKARASQYAMQVEHLGNDIETRRTYLDTTDQLAVENFNLNVQTYNSMLQVQKTQNQVVNRMVNAYNAKLRLYGE